MASQTTQILKSIVTGNQVLVQFADLPNNLPNSYGNYVAIWRNQNTIPWNNTSPDGYAAITGNSSQGAQTVDVSIAPGVSYVVGYGVGPKVGTGNQMWANICASMYVPATGASTYLSPALTDFQIFPDTVMINFQLPSGATPVTNGAWIGIWQTSDASYTTPPIAANSINLNSSQGSAAINGVNVQRGQTYTVALFTSGWKAGAGNTNVQTAMACTITATT